MSAHVSTADLTLRSRCPKLRHASCVFGKSGTAIRRCFFFLVRSDKNVGDDVQSMVEKEILGESDISMATAGSNSFIVASIS